MATTALATILVLLLSLGGGQAATLEARLQLWPHWQLPAPLPRPGRTDLVYPEWFAGHWQVSSCDGETDLRYPVQFRPDPQGRVVGDRAFNAAAVGRAVFGSALLAVADDPANPNRQLARLAGDQQLESTVIGRSTALAADASFWADELALQVLHGPGDPRISRVETLSRYRRLGPDRIEAEQWQTSYGSPADGLAASARSSWHGKLRLIREPEEPDPVPGPPGAQGRPT
jgi:hypothetical protein